MPPYIHQTKLGIYLLLCQTTASRLPQRQLSRAACSFLTAPPWSPVIPSRHLCCSCTTSLWHNLHQAASEYHICYLSLNPQRRILFARCGRRAERSDSKGHPLHMHRTAVLCPLYWLLLSLHFHSSWNVTSGYFWWCVLPDELFRTFQTFLLNISGVHVCWL